MFDRLFSLAFVVDSDSLQYNFTFTNITRQRISVNCGLREIVHYRFGGDFCSGDSVITFVLVYGTEIVSRLEGIITSNNRRYSMNLTAMSNKGLQIYDEELQMVVNEMVTPMTGIRIFDDSDRFLQFFKQVYANEVS